MKNEQNPQFTFYWLTGDRNVFHGTDAADALNKAGYGNGALRALDFYAPGDDKNYVWNAAERKWDMTPEYKEKMFGKKD